MEQIEAKPVVEDKFWILHKDKTKVGQVKESSTGVEVNINGQTVTRFNNIEDFKKDERFSFTEIKRSDYGETDHVYGYDTSTLAYNPLWNLQYNLPIYTKEPDSKSWHCAGYYKIKIGKNWTTEFSPKLITLQRNEYEGPFPDPFPDPKETLFDSR